jgi:hypothetical protein
VCRIATMTRVTGVEDVEPFGDRTMAERVGNGVSAGHLATLAPVNGHEAVPDARASLGPGPARVRAAALIDVLLEPRLQPGRDLQRIDATGLHATCPLLAARVARAFSRQSRSDRWRAQYSASRRFTGGGGRVFCSSNSAICFGV